MAFLRNGDGLVGFGSRIDFADAATDRLPRIMEWWAELCAAALVEDEVNLPGTGLVAFGSFAFSATSADPSVLSVPAVVIGRRGGVSWMTTIDGGLPAAQQPRGPPPHEQLGPGSLKSLSPGAMSEDAYRAAVVTATAAIVAGRAEKVVVARELLA
ncbi:MAG: isochorismate synthase, partial [Salinibacterium sp.]|nr:isochorismate synthase [Salinibacterium sp.]